MRLEGYTYRTLDVGIRKGGAYIQDSPDVLRVGADIDREGMGICKQRFPTVECVTADAIHGNLPFADKSFNNVDVLFPHDGLLFDLSYTGRLWKEFKRVLRQSGSVNIVLDVYHGDYRMVTVDGQDLRILSPQICVSSLAELNGFYCQTIKITHSILDEYNTAFSKNARRRMKKGPDYSCYKILAKKPS